MRGRRAGVLGALAGLHRPRRRRAHARRASSPRCSVEPYESAGRPPARAHARRPEGGAPAPAPRDAHAARADLPAPRRADRCRRRAASPTLEATRAASRHGCGGSTDPDAIAETFADAQLLIADGHHRYETALAFHEEDGHAEARLDDGRDRRDRPGGADDLPDASARAAVTGCSAAADRPRRGARRVEALPGTSESPSTAQGALRRRRGAGELDAEVVERLAPRASRTRRTRDEAVAAVDRGEAEAAFLLRPTRHRGGLGDRARRGEVMPQKSTYFYPKLTSGLLFHPVVTDWLAVCRAAVADVAGVLAELPTRAEREPVSRQGEGGDDTTAIDQAAEDGDPRAASATRRRRSSRRRSARFGDGADGRRRRPDRRLAERQARHPVLLALDRGRRRLDDGRRVLRLRLRLRHRRGVGRRRGRRRLPERRAARRRHRRTRSRSSRSRRR